MAIILNPLKNIFYEIANFVKLSDNVEFHLGVEEITGLEAAGSDSLDSSSRNFVPLKIPDGIK